MPHFPFAAIVGQERLKLALQLAAIDPQIGGVLIQGPRGTAKSTIARALADLLPEGRFITLPLGATEERLVGTLNLEKVLVNGQVAFSPGLLQAAHQGVLYVDEVNLLPDHLVDLLLDVSASGINVVERDGVSHSHPARFVLIGTMNPDEGELRPQLLDRFGFAVALDDAPDLEQRMEIVHRRLIFDSDPEHFCQAWREQQQTLRERCRQARAGLAGIELDRSTRLQIAELCRQADVEGVRADLVILRAARAHAAWQDREAIHAEDVEAVAELALYHRRQQVPPSSRNSQAPPPKTADNQASSSEGVWGEMPPQVVEIGPAREVAGRIKKS